MDPISIALALSEFAPSILRYFGVGEKPIAVAQKVIDIAQDVTGKSDSQEAIQLLKTDPKLAIEFRSAVIAADTELERMTLADRQDARAHDVEVRKLNNGQNRRQDVMIVGVVVGLISCLAVLVIFRERMPGEVVGILSMIAGIFGACMKDAYSFEFGSSRGSKEKDAIIGDIAKMP